jgi:hypothetical protein
MEIVYKSHFKGFVKKQNRGFQLAIEDAIDRIKADPAIGKEETVDLTGFLIYKFAFKDREYLIAYKLEKTRLACYMMGTHEIFYRDLKVT